MKSSSQFVLGLAAFAALGVSAQAAPFTAYNDCNINTASANPANTTVYGFGGAATTSGQLKDFASGTSQAATVTVVNSGGVTVGSGPTAEFTAGSPAANMFGGKAINTGSVNYYGGAGWYFQLQFTNLTPGAKYNLATTVDRGNSSPAPAGGYTNRWTVISLLGADSSTAAYATGSGIVAIGPTAASLQSYNTDVGNLAQWTNIDPGADNAFTVNFTYAVAAGEIGPSGQDGVKAYGPAMFMVSEVAVPEPASLSILMLGGLLMGRRRHD